MIHEQIKELRLEHDISRSDLAESLGISLSALGNYERGERVPDADLVVKFARYFSVTTDYLLGMSEHKTAEYEAMSKTIPLSDEAIDFIKDCSPELRYTLDLMLSDSNVNDFLTELMTYVYSLKYGENSEGAEIISYKLSQGRDSLVPSEEVGKLLSRLQQMHLFEALERLGASMKEAKYGKEE